MLQWINEKALEYKIKFYPANEPTYPRTNSYLDIALIDDRIFVHNSHNQKIKTLTYDSDHRALEIKINIKQNIDLAIPPSNPKNKFLFKNTNWEKFNKYLLKHNHQIIQNNKTLTIDEVNFEIKCFTNTINEAIQKVVPTYKPNNSMEKYVDNEIANLKPKKNTY